MKVGVLSRVAFLVVAVQTPIDVETSALCIP